MSMSRARFDSIFNGMTSAAKKVYDAVPNLEQWSMPKIVMEMQRCQVSLDYRVVGGCLNTLLGAGLIREPANGEFKRESIREIIKTEKNKEPEAMPQATKPVIAKPVAKAEGKQVSPLDRLEDLSKRVTAMAAQLTELAEDIGDAAIEIQSQMDTDEQNVTKLRQLQMLLKSLEITN